MRISLSIIVFALGLTFESSGLELVHLKNGFTLEADSHHDDDGTVVMHIEQLELKRVSRAEFLKTSAALAATANRQLPRAKPLTSDFIYLPPFVRPFTALEA